MANDKHSTVFRNNFPMYLGYSENESSAVRFQYRVSRSRSLAKARQRLLQDSAHACRTDATYASRIFFFFLTLFDNAVVLVQYAICGKATWLSAGKSGRQLCIPSLVPPSLPPLSITNVLSFLFFLHRSCFFFATLPFLPVHFISRRLMS